MDRAANDVWVSLPLPRAEPEAVGMSSVRLARLGDRLREDIDKGRMPGAMVAIARRGHIVHFEAYGYRDREADVPMTEDTIFNIASMTKPVTAVTALTLYEEGRLLIDEPLGHYLPAFRDMRVARLDETKAAILGTEPAARPITIQDLMLHTCGIVYGGRGTTAVHKQLVASSAGLVPMSRDEVIARLSGVPMLHQPGAVWDYGFGLDLLGLVIETITGQPLGKAMDERVFAPLGMQDTAFHIPADKARLYARALPRDPETGAAQTAGIDLTKAPVTQSGGGGLGSTAADYLRFALMLLGKGLPGETRVMGRKTAEYMLSDHLGPQTQNLIRNADPTRAGYGFGLGLAVRNRVGHLRMAGSVGEFSWPGASGTNWWADPREELVVVFMAHTPGTIRWHYRELVAALVNQAIVD